MAPSGGTLDQVTLRPVKSNWYVKIEFDVIQSEWAKNRILARSLNAPCETLSSIDHLQEDELGFKHTTLFRGDQLMCTSKKAISERSLHPVEYICYVVIISQCSQRWEEAAWLPYCR